MPIAPSPEVTRGALLHFSEDPAITRFVPHVPKTNPSQSSSVWAIDAAHAPAYWFPRNCPRGTVWANDEAELARLRALFLTSASRVHATELEWLDRIRATTLFVYELDPQPFAPWPEAEGQWISKEAVEPLSVRPVGDLLARHAEAGIELRLMPDLGGFWDAVVSSGLPFSGIRLGHRRAAKV
jgi:hypothetical protein